MTAAEGRDSGDVQRVREATDIVAVIGQYVALLPAGENLKGVCPFHQDTKPSFTVSPSKQVYYCFGCGEGGNVFTFVMKMEGLAFGEALRKLAARAGISLSSERRPSPEERQRSRLAAIVADAAAFYAENLKAPDEFAEKARRYLRERGLGAETAAAWELGLAPDAWDGFLRRATRAGFEPAEVAAAGLAVPSKERGGFYDRFRGRITFPIRNAAGQLVAFGGRILGDGEPKYLNSANSPLYVKGETLYGFFQNRAAISRAGSCLVVEGYMDLLGLVEAGVENVVATCGTAVTAEGATTLARYARDLVLLFDGDEAGLRAARRGAPMLIARGARVRVALLPPGKDPFDISREGPAAVAATIGAAADWLDALVDVTAREHGGDRVAAKLAVIREAGSVVASIPDELERKLWQQRLADRLGIAAAEFELPDLRTRREREKPGGLSPAENLLRILVQYPEEAMEALAEIEHCSGAQFGPDLVKAFSRCRKEIQLHRLRPMATV